MLLWELVAHVLTDLPYIFVVMELTSECWLPVHFQPNCRLSCCLSAFPLAYMNVIKNLSNGVVQYNAVPFRLSFLFCSSLSVCSVSLRSLALSECFLVAQETVTSLR